MNAIYLRRPIRAIGVESKSTARGDRWMVVFREDGRGVTKLEFPTRQAALARACAMVRWTDAIASRS